ncbi:MAG: efflux RND transporter periplasmic adaptor subunit [Planctomycetota bacterium]|jgi:multidrug resistance efflux pump
MSRADRIRRLAPVLALVVRFGLGVVLLVVAVGVFGWLERTRPEPGQVDPESIRPRVAVLELRPMAVERSWTGFGTARAMDAADVPARVTATVLEIPPSIEAGTTVTAGAVLARLDPTDFEARLRAATESVADLSAQLEGLTIEQARLADQLELLEERVRLAEAELARVEDAAGSGAARPREVDAARAALAAVRGERVSILGRLEAIPPTRTATEARRAAAEAQRTQAAADLDRCVIRAPDAPAPPAGSGPRRWVVQSVDIEPGEAVAAGQRIARVVDPGRLEIPVRLPAAARRGIAVGDPVQLQPAGDAAELGQRGRIAGTIARIAPEDDPATRTATVYVELLQAAGDAGAIAPGRFVRATVRESDRTPRIIVPRRSLAGERLLVVDEDGLVRGRDVERWFDVRGSYPETGLADGDWVALRDPPPAGTRIVVAPTRRIIDGTAVIPVAGGEAVGGVAP